MAHISVVIPVYNAEECLRVLFDRLKASLESITSDFEVVLVEDCGQDRSWDIIVELAQKDPRVKGIQFSRNFGQHYSITAGLDHCDGDWVVVMDCDLQDAPEEIPRLYAKAREGYDVVLARRLQRTDNVLKCLTSWLFYKVFNYLADINYDGQAGNFRIISGKVAKSFKGMRERLRFFGGMIDWMGYPTASIDVQHGARAAGKSSYTYRRLFGLARETIVAYSDKPLRFAVKIGLTMSGISFFLGGYMIFRRLVYGVPILGWTSLIVSLYFLGGIIIMILGILGIYVGATFSETKKRPLYLMRRTTFSSENSAG